MAELVPTYSITEFKKLKVPELKQLKCCEITADGEYLFTFINPRTGYIRNHVEYLGNLSNTVGGKKMEEIMEVVEV